jgi:hypothetical protein
MEDEWPSSLGVFQSCSRQSQMNLTELKSGHVFRLRSAHDIFRKLYREKQRFETAGLDRKGQADQVDAAINFAITAWHMTDWVWHQQQQKLCEYFEVKCLREFQDEMRRRCPSLAVCDIIANAAKHGGTAHKREDRPEIETVLVAHPVAKREPSVEFLAVSEHRWWSLLAYRRWSLKIEVDGTPQDPLALLNSVHLHWHKFIQQHCVTKEPS